MKAGVQSKRSGNGDGMRKIGKVIKWTAGILLIIFLCGVGCILYGLKIEPYIVRTEKVSLDTGLSEQLTVVQVSDIQISESYTTRHFQKVVDRIISLEKEYLMSNSKLVDYTILSPNKTSPRSSAIKKITIHHMAGFMTVEECGAMFAKTSQQASSNYAVDNDGRVDMYVEEKDRSWCSSNPENDHQAITIEVANLTGAPDWKVSDTAMEKLIELCTDICRRNNIEKLNFTGDKNGNLTMHKWFTATACLGPYLESKFPYIAAEVNKRLTASENGWKQIGKKWYYYENGQPVKSAWRKITGSSGTFWYSFDADGVMMIGMQKIGEKIYWFNEIAAFGLSEGALIVTDQDGVVQV